MLDEREGDVRRRATRRARSTAQSVGARIAIVARGPVANFLLAIAALLGALHGRRAGPASRCSATPPPARRPPSPACAAATTVRRRRRRAGRRPGRTCAGCCSRTPGSDEPRRGRRASARAAATRHAQRSTSRDSPASDWDSDVPAQARPAPPTSGAPLIGEIARRQAGASAPGSRAATASSPIDGAPVRSPVDVAARDQRAARAAAACSASSAAAHAARRRRRRPRRSRERRAPHRHRRAAARASIRAMARAHVDARCATARSSAVAQGAHKTWDLSVFSLKMLGRMVIGDVSLKNISGPDHASPTTPASRRRWARSCSSASSRSSASASACSTCCRSRYWMAGICCIISPKLCKGSPVSDRAIEIGQRIGMAVLAALMAFALFNDFTRLF